MSTGMAEPRPQASLGWGRRPVNVRYLGAARSMVLTFLAQGLSHHSRCRRVVRACGQPGLGLGAAFSAPLWPWAGGFTCLSSLEAVLWLLAHCIRFHLPHVQSEVS